MMSPRLKTLSAAAMLLVSAFSSHADSYISRTHFLTEQWFGQESATRETFFPRLSYSLTNGLAPKQYVLDEIYALEQRIPTDVRAAATTNYADSVAAVAYTNALNDAKAYTDGETATTWQYIDGQVGDLVSRITSTSNALWGVTTNLVSLSTNALWAASTNLVTLSTNALWKSTVRRENQISNALAQAISDIGPNSYILVTNPVVSGTSVLLDNMSMTAISSAGGFTSTNIWTWNADIGLPQPDVVHDEMVGTYSWRVSAPPPGISDGNVSYNLPLRDHTTEYFPTDDPPSELLPLEYWLATVTSVTVAATSPLSVNAVFNGDWSELSLDFTAYFEVRGAVGLVTFVDVELYYSELFTAAVLSNLVSHVDGAYVLSPTGRATSFRFDYVNQIPPAHYYARPSGYTGGLTACAILDTGGYIDAYGSNVVSQQRFSPTLDVTPRIQLDDLATTCSTRTNGVLNAYLPLPSAGCARDLSVSVGNTTTNTLHDFFTTRPEDPDTSIEEAASGVLDIVPGTNVVRFLEVSPGHIMAYRETGGGGWTPPDDLVVPGSVTTSNLVVNGSASVTGGLSVSDGDLTVPDGDVNVDSGIVAANQFVGSFEGASWESFTVSNGHSMGDSISDMYDNLSEDIAASTNEMYAVVSATSNALASASVGKDALVGRVFDFSDMRGLYLAISNLVSSLGGTVTNFPSLAQ